MDWYAFHLSTLSAATHICATASADETVQITVPSTSSPGLPTPKPIPPLTHPLGVKAILPIQLTPVGEPLLLTAYGDLIRTYDVSDPYTPELLSTTDAHWFDVTALRLWARRIEKGGKAAIEPWVVSVSLDQTVRKWRLADLVSPPKDIPKSSPKKEKIESGLTAEEEAELAELMQDE